MATRDIYTRCFDEQTDKQSPTDTCPECDGTLRTDSGETTCTDCGLVLDEYRFDHRGPRTFSDDTESRERTGAPLTQVRHDRGLSTKIGTTEDGQGNKLSASKRRQLGRLRREHTRAKWQSTAERNLAHGCTEIARLVSALDLPHDIREQASRLFRTAQNADLLRGRAIESIAAGCVYAACRCNGVTRTLDEVIDVARCDRGRVTNAYTVLNRELELPTPPRRPREFIPAHAAAVDLPPATERFARQLAERAYEAGISTGADPAGFAAACIEVAAADHDVDVQQLELAEAADVSAATVRGHRDTVQARLAKWSL